MTTMTAPVREFRRVPFNPDWLNQDKLDLKAIYRRPRYARTQFDDIVRVLEDGMPAWDLTGPLPVRRHNDWVAKGFEYLTLADRSSLNQVAGMLRAVGLNPADFDQHPEYGPWNPKLFLATQQRVDRDAHEELRRMVERFGSDAVVQIRRASEPAFELPADLQDIPAGGNAPAAPEPANTAAPATPARPRKPAKPPSEVNG